MPFLKDPILVTPSKGGQEQLEVLRKKSECKKQSRAAQVQGEKMVRRKKYWDHITEPEFGKSSMSWPQRQRMNRRVDEKSPATIKKELHLRSKGVTKIHARHEEKPNEGNDRIRGVLLEVW